MGNTNRFSILIISLTILFTVNLIASNGTQIGTVGGRSTAMGSAFRGLADDWSAGYFNPAGLTQLEGFTIGATVGLIAPRGSLTQAPYPMYPFSGLNTNKVDLENKNFIVPAMGIYFKPAEKMTLGLLVNAPFGLGTEWDLVDIPDTFNSSLKFSKKNEHYSDHQVIVMQPTFAYEVSKKLSLGLGVSYIMGKMDLDQTALAFNPIIASWPALQAGSQGALKDLGDRARVPVENNLTGDGSAFGVNAGLLFNVNEKLSVGLSCRYFTDLKLSGTIKQTKTLSSPDPEINAVLDGMAAALQAAGQDAQAAQVLGAKMAFPGIAQVAEWDVEAAMPLPLTAGIGLAYKATDKLTITADVELNQWSSWDMITVESQDAAQGDLELKEDWKDTYQMGVGFEFLAMSKEEKDFYIRAGFYTTDTPSPQETISPTILDPVRRNVITGGLGLDMGRVSLNLVGEMIMFSDKTMTSADYVFDPATGVSENYAGVYKFSAYVVTLGTQIEL